MRHLPPTGGSLCSLAAVSSATIPVRVKLKIPRANAAAATTLDIPTGWDLQQRRPRPVADAGRSLLGQRPARRTCRPRHARMLGAATRGTKKEPTGLFFAACGRPCSFDSSYGLHETATTLDIPSRWDPRANQSPTGLIAYPAAQGRAVRFLCGLHETATTLDIPTGWDPNTKKEPTGLFFAACGRPCSFDSSYGLHEKIPDPKIRDFIHDPYGNRTHVTAVKGPCLNRLTNGP